MVRIAIFLTLLGVAYVCHAQRRPVRAQLTNYCSYPPCCPKKHPPYSKAEEKCSNDECTKYDGCKYQGKFKYCGQQSHEWVKSNNIVAIYSDQYSIQEYINKTITIVQGGKMRDAFVCDTCSNSDCNNCCTENRKGAPYLIDMEINTYARSGFKDGEVAFRLK